MNPELRMLWMSQYGPERMILDDATPFYGQPTVGLSVMDDISPTGAMDMNPMMGIVGGEYSGQGTPTIGVHTANPTGSISSANPNDIYGLAQTVSGIHPMLHQHPVFQPFHNLVEDDDGDMEESNSFPHPYEQMDDSSCYDSITGHDNSSGLTDHKGLLGMDDFVMQMNANDSNSYPEAAMMSDEMNVNETKIQTAVKKAKKIEPVKRPGLVLKTPIAYQGNTDPSVIPIQRDGMAVCERCGAIGVRHTFYTKTRRYCSMACARGELYNLVLNENNKLKGSVAAANNNSHNTGNPDEPDRTDLELELRVSHIKNPTYRFKMSDETNIINGENGTNNEIGKPVLYRDVLPQEEVPHIVKFDRLPSPCPQDDKIFSVRRKQYDHLNSFDWTAELNKPNFYGAPVTCFPHAPGYDMWDNIGIDMKVEVENTDCDSQSNVAPGQTPHSFWVATILKIFGYKALMRYEGFDDDSHDFWVNLCSSEVHSVGWCATRGKPLIPPKTIENKYTDWKDFLVQRLSGARTLPSIFYNKISESFKSRFRCGLNLEVVDKDRISYVKLATVHKIVGKRLLVKYFDNDVGFWCHEDAPIIHPVGWATAVGHNLDAPPEYLQRMKGGPNQMVELHDDDARIDIFKMNFRFEDYIPDRKTIGFKEGMKLEAVDPLNLSSICVATVMKVLKFGYIMIRIDFYDPDATGNDWFCYHETSPCILPVGFCAANNISLTPPNGYTVESFEWDKYLEETGNIPASEHLFHKASASHGFKSGMKLECADLMDPRLVCVATVGRVVGRLIKVQFDGWGEEYDQWLDCESPDVYPVGWCVLVGHKLEGPPQQAKTQKPTKKKRKKKIKNENTNLRPVNRSANVKKEVQDSCNKNASCGNDRLKIKTEFKHEPHENEEDEDDDCEDDVSHSDQSTPLPVTPEPTEKNKQTNNVAPKTITNNTAPPPERKATSYINNSSVTNSKYIPRLTDINNSPETSSSYQSNELSPETWSVHDVSQFLRINDCTSHCDTFSRNKIDGKKLLKLSKDEIITLLGMKVGPALKIFDLIQQLNCKVMKANINKKYT